MRARPRRGLGEKAGRLRTVRRVWDKTSGNRECKKRQAGGEWWAESRALGLGSSCGKKKNGCNEGLKGGGKLLGQGAGKSQAAGAKGYKKADMLLLGNRQITIIAFTHPELELNPKFLILPLLCHQACWQTPSHREEVLRKWSFTIILLHKLLKWQRSAFIIHVGGSMLQTIFEVCFGKKKKQALE